MSITKALHNTFLALALVASLVGWIALCAALLVPPVLGVLTVFPLALALFRVEGWSSDLRRYYLVRQQSDSYAEEFWQEEINPTPVQTFTVGPKKVKVEWAYG